MKKTIGLLGLLFLPLALAAPPDFSVNYRFTNRTGETTDAITIFTTPASTPAIPNYIYGCSAWQLTYNSEGFSVISLNFQTNTRVWTGGIQQGPGNAVSTFGGTTVVGTLPLTATTQGTFIGYGYYPYVYINLATATGTGSVDVQLKCWNSITYAYNGNFLAGNLVTSGAGFLGTMIYSVEPASDVVCAHGGDTSIAGITCNNTAGTEATSATLFASSWAQAAGFWASNHVARICGQFRYWSSTGAPTNTPGLYWTSTSNPAYAPVGALGTNNGQSSVAFTDCFLMTNDGTAGHVTTSPETIFKFTSTDGAAGNSTAQPKTGLTTAISWFFEEQWAATGILSGTYTSGGSITGTVTQTCNITLFNNGNTAGTATVALTGTNTIAGGTALVITNTGYGSTSAATSATFGNGTATCSGNPTIATALGGAQGNAKQLLAMTVQQLN